MPTLPASSTLHSNFEIGRQVLTKFDSSQREEILLRKEIFRYRDEKARVLFLRERL